MRERTRREREKERACSTSLSTVKSASSDNGSVLRRPVNRSAFRDPGGQREHDAETRLTHLPYQSDRSGNCHRHTSVLCTCEESPVREIPIFARL